MNKLLIEIYVPAIGKTFDVYIPCNAKVFELLPLVTIAVRELSGDLFVPNDVTLCNGSTGVIYSQNTCVGDMQLKNGTRLMLI